MKDREARCCNGCGQIVNQYPNQPKAIRIKVPEYRNSFGRVPGWYALACSETCRPIVAAGIAQDLRDIARLEGRA